MRHLLQLDDEIDDQALDQFIERIAANIRSNIDCMACGNCCRRLVVYLTPDDIQRIARHISPLNSKTFITLIESEGRSSSEEWAKLNHRPCSFLKGKVCTIYSTRPETCRTYPAFTPDFRWVLEYLINGSHLCPIIFNVLSEISSLVDEISSGRLQLSASNEVDGTINQRN